MRLISLPSALVLGCFALPFAFGSDAPRSRVSPPDVALLDDGLEELEALAETLIRARKPADRDAAFAVLLDKADEDRRAEELLGAALNERWQAVIKDLESLKLEKKLGRLLGQREKLDLARKEALRLIEDEDKYFYPYRQPDVTAEQAAQYPKVQVEVSKRVSDLQDVWEKSLKVKLPRSAPEALAEMQWLRGHGSHAPGGFSLPASLPEWVPFLPVDVKEIDLSNFPLNAEEASRMVRDRKVELYNERIWEECKEPKRTRSEEEERQLARFPTEAEREQVRVTNRYRNMMGRPSLTWDPRLQEAAHYHSEYQTRTGEFGHFQKVPETRTPFDRMRLAGYPRGVSENCALGASDPAGAHANWMRSSGHHRNLIKAGHKQMASAVSGNIWTQNYGTDGGAEDDL